MKGFFRVDGVFFSVTSRMVDMAVLSLFWMIGCIPVVTFFTSTASLYQAAVKCIRYDRGKAYQEFIDCYKKNLKQGIALTILYLLAGSLIGFADYYLFCIVKDRSYITFMAILFMMILSQMYIINVIWMAPVFSRFSNTLANLLRLNYVISIRLVIKSACMTVIMLTAVLLTFAAPPLVLIMPAAAWLIISYLSENGLHRFMPKQEEENGDWRYGYK